ncbi:MAG TPA: GDSL-type esterase/lipase family protein [Streptosporangiaceae bacterium]
MARGARWGAAVVAAAVLAGALAADRGPAPRHGGGNPVPGYGVRLMIVGDSITQGASGSYTWRYRLWRHLTGAGTAVDFVGPRTDLYDFVNARWGDHDYAAPRFDWDHDALSGEPLSTALTTIEAQVRQYRPRYLLVLLGTNDLAIFHATPQQTAADMRILVANARRARPDLRFVLGRIPPMTPNPATGPDVDASIAAYDSGVAGVARELSTVRSPIAVADTYTGYDDGRDSWDGTHPNARGELKIAAAFEDALHTAYGLGPAAARPIPQVPVGPVTAPRLRASGGAGGVLLSWTPVPGATGYWLWRREVGVDGGFTRLPDPLNTRSIPWRDTGLASGVTYAYRVQPIQGRDAGEMSPPVQAATTADGPPAPRLTAVAGDREARLTWTPTPGASYWVLLRRPGERGFRRLPYPVSGPEFTLRPLANGKRYELRLQRTGGLSDGPLTNVSAVVPHG